MEQILTSSELIKRLNQWPDMQKAVTKENVAVIKNETEDKEAEMTNGNIEGDGEGEMMEEENPALEGHFLTEGAVELTVVEGCMCPCHVDQVGEEMDLPFTCSKCSQLFCCKCQFMVHRDLHRGQRKYTCEICEKSYYYKSDLVRHQPSHSVVKPHVCKVCGRSFNQVGHLITHRLVHTGEKPFPCDVCNKPFNRKSNLQKHKMIHTGERPFMCLVCGSRFSRKGDLQRHTMLHTGERPFKCDVCNKTFSQKPHLLSHQSVHTGERPYKCVACGKSFNRKSNLLNHQLTKCKAISLKRGDGMDLELSDFAALPSSSFFTHLTPLIVCKSDEESDKYYDSMDLKPVVLLKDDGVMGDMEDTSNSSATETSMLRKRLSGGNSKEAEEAVKAITNTYEITIDSTSEVRSVEIISEIPISQDESEKSSENETVHLSHSKSSKT